MGLSVCYPAAPLAGELSDLSPFLQATLPDELLADAGNDTFDLKIEVAPRSDGKGYLFSLQLTPKAGVHFKRINQNYFFLIDRSNSISRNRYRYSCKAVLKSLSALNRGDTFNILLFDSQVVALSTSNLPWNESNCLEAAKFLQRQHHGGFFATTDLYASLGQIIPQQVAEEEINTAILLSDGDTFLGMESQRKTIARWTRKNGGKVALFAIAAGLRNNLGLLNLLCTFNRGMLLYVPDIKHLDQELTQLLQKLRRPIGKEIVVTAIPKDPDAHIFISPVNERLPHLYEDIPYIVYGTIDKLSDFTLFFQGRHYDRWFHIKRDLSFESAKSADSSLQAAWNQQRAYGHYERFLQDGDVSHLHLAKQLLFQTTQPVAF
jgi:hypothetical protein